MANIFVNWSLWYTNHMGRIGLAFKILTCLAVGIASPIICNAIGIGLIIKAYLIIAAIGYAVYYVGKWMLFTEEELNKEVWDWVMRYGNGVIEYSTRIADWAKRKRA